MSCYHFKKGECPHLFINGEDKGPADDMLFQMGVWSKKVRDGKETKEQAIARALSTPDRKYEIRYLPE